MMRRSMEVESESMDIRNVSLMASFVGFANDKENGEKMRDSMGTGAEAASMVLKA